MYRKTERNVVRQIDIMSRTGNVNQTGILSHTDYEPEYF